MRQFIVAGVCVLGAWSAQAEPVPLGDDTLKPTLAGKTVRLDTPLGVSIPITYHGNGLMSGKAGVLEYFLGAEQDRGRWWVADGKLCQKWFKWLDAQPSCMRLKQAGNRIFWQRDDGMSGTATIEAGLAPGADARPRGLGVPLEAAPPGRPPAATEPRERVARASLALPPALLRRAPAEAAPPAPEPRPQPAMDNADAGPGSPDHGKAKLTIIAEHVPTAGQDDGWCRSLSPAVPDADAPPGLVVVARLPYGPGELAASAGACLSAELALRRAAVLRLE
jgi:hypothetical protein